MCKTIIRINTIYQLGQTKSYMLAHLTKESNKLAVLNQEIDRLLRLPKMCQTNPDFWLGYISSYSAKVCSRKSKPFNDDDWKELYEVIQVTITLASEKAIRQENICEAIVYSVFLQLRAEHPENTQGLSLVKIRESIQMLLANLIENNGHIKAKYFQSNIGNAVLPEQKLEKFSKSMLHMKGKIEKKQEVSSSLMKEEPIGSIGVECPICVCEVTLQTVCPVSCGHNLHKACLIEHFKQRVANKKLPIPCPEAGCNAEIIMVDLQQYIPRQLLEKYYEFSLHEFVEKNSKNTNWCPTPGCQAVFTFENDLTTYRCPSCKKEYCLSCKTQFHKGQTCEQHKMNKDMSNDDQQFLAFVAGAKMKQCPSCKFWVEKNKGCDHMTCRCSYEFCFRCGAKYGQGDCQCDERDSFYGDDDDDQNDEEESNGSEGIDFEDEVEHESEVRVIPPQQNARIQRVLISRIRIGQQDRLRMEQEERDKNGSLFELIRKSLQK